MENTGKVRYLRTSLGTNEKKDRMSQYDACHEYRELESTKIRLNVPALPVAGQEILVQGKIWALWIHKGFNGLKSSLP